MEMYHALVYEKVVVYTVKYNNFMRAGLATPRLFFEEALVQKVFQTKLHLKAQLLFVNSYLH